MPLSHSRWAYQVGGQPSRGTIARPRPRAKYSTTVEIASRCAVCLPSTHSPIAGLSQSAEAGEAREAPPQDKAQ